MKFAFSHILHRLSIRSAIIAVVGFMIVNSLLIGGVALYSADRTIRLFESEVMRDLRLQHQLGELALKMETNRSQVLQALQHMPGTEFAKLHDHPLQVHLTEIEKNSAALSSMWRTFHDELAHPSAVALAESWHERSDSLGMRPVRTAAAAIAAGDWAGAELVLIRQINPTYRHAAPEMGNLRSFVQDQVTSATERAHVLTERQQTLIGGAMLLGAVLSSLLGWYLVRGIERPLSGAVELAQRVADGALDHTVNVVSDNEFGALQTALSNMQSQLAQIVTQVRSSASNVATATQEIAAGNTDLSTRTERQAEALVRTAHSMNELTARVSENAVQARRANDMVRAASTSAERGGDVVEQVVSTMDAIAQSSARIADIVGLIDGIAFQTNILALNAAVEAARAGQAGQGFAVVAGEVRALAQRSASAAREVKVLIDECVIKVGQGASMVQEAGMTMSDIVDRISQAAGVMDSISAANDDQHRSIEGVAGTMRDLEGATQETAAMVEEAAAAAISLREQAEHLRDLVSIFQVQEDAVVSQEASRLRLPGRSVPVRMALVRN